MKKREVGTIRHGSLFSGIGGFDLAADTLGWSNVFHCELDPFCKRVLTYYFPNAVSHDDIRKTNFKKYKEQIDVLTGGFPCQPYSLAGKRLGKEDPRHLWPEMLRAVHEIRPVWVLGENVRGLINWNGGMVFDEVQSDLEAAGYSVLPFLLPAAGVNAPHKRERIWFVAFRNSGGNSSNTNNGKQQEQQEGSSKNRQHASAARSIAWTGTGTGNSDRDTAERIRQLATGAGFLQETSTHSNSFRRDDGRDNRQKRQVQTDQRDAPEDQQEWQGRQRGASQANAVFTDTNLTGLEGETSKRIQDGTRGANQLYDVQPSWNSGAERWKNFPETEPTIRIGNDGLPDSLDFNTVFEGIPFPLKPISFSRWRTESIKSLGNAIVPQVAVMLFRIIQVIHEEQYLMK
jgi:DNA (cytosine-5)-methyltransferase 1